jgi:hypothetical protein
VNDDFEAVASQGPASLMASVLLFSLALSFAGPAHAEFDACEETPCTPGLPCRSEKEVTCVEDPNGVPPPTGGQGGSGGVAVICHANEVARCGPYPCEHDDECGEGEICFGTIAFADYRFTDPCPDEPRCVVEPATAVGTVSILGWCMAARRCDGEDDCDDGSACLDYRYQCDCPDAEAGERCGGGGIEERGPDGKTLCVCDCQSGLCSAENLQGVGGRGPWSIGDAGAGGVGGVSSDDGGTSTGGRGPSSSGGGQGGGGGSGSAGSRSAADGGQPTQDPSSFGSGSASTADQEEPSAGACSVSMPAGRGVAPPWLLCTLALLGLRRGPGRCERSER